MTMVIDQVFAMSLLAIERDIVSINNSDIIDAFATQNRSANFV